MSDERDHPGGDDPLSRVTPVSAADESVGTGQNGPPDVPPDDVPPAPPEDGDTELPIAECAQFPLNDYGNGQRFVTYFGADFLSVPRVGWFRWDGRVWQKDPDELSVRRYAQRLSEMIQREVPYLPLTQSERNAVENKSAWRRRRVELEKINSAERSAEQDQELGELRRKLDAVASVEKAIGQRRRDHRSFARTSGNSTRIENAYREASVELSCDFEDLDADMLAVNCETGVLRFHVVRGEDEGMSPTADVDLVPHARDQKLSKIMPVQYDPAAPREKFDAFLQRVQPDRAMRDFLKRWFGLSMTGLPMQRLLFLYGGGANGKSVLVDVIARCLGNYAATARIESITGTNRRGGSEATPDLIPLMGARFVRTSEPEEGQRLQEGLIKELTGGEPIQVRALQKDFVEVRPVFKLTMSGNHKPDIRGTDDGIWRRVMLVPFDVQIPESERDPDLVSKLVDEGPGILNWLVEGLLEFLERGLDPPEAVVEATREYREESDPIGVFLTTCCVVTGEPEDIITSKELGNAFAFHLIERGMSPWRPATFARQIAAKARHWRHPQTGQQFAKGKASVTQYVGLRLTDAFARRFENAPKDQQGRPLAGDTAAPDPDAAF